MAATDALLAAALRRDPSGPLITFYDDGTGDRAELSATTLNTWVAKTANLLQDELSLQPGERVAVLLPAHWQTAAVLLASWAAGGVVTGDPAGAEVAFTDAGSLPFTGDAAQAVALSLAPLGRPFPHPPEGALDYAAVVPGQADHYVPYEPVADDAPALVDAAGGVRTGAELVAAARDRAAALGLAEGARVLSTLPWTGAADVSDLLLDGLLAPLTAGASLVLCAHPDPAALPARAAAERVTVTLGTSVADIPVAGR